MAGITSTGIGSGLDINALVSQLVAAERAPVDQRLTRSDARLTSDLSAVSKLKGALSAFEVALAALKLPATFDPRKAGSGDEKLFTASAQAGAVPGHYDVEVQQLASAARLGSQLYAGGPDSAVGSGTLVIDVGGKTLRVEIGQEVSTLAQLRDAINGATDNPGVSAMLVRDATGTGSYLVLAGSATGAQNAITVSAEGADGELDALVQALGSFDADRDVAAADAVVFVSGYEIHSASNTISDAIDGVTLELVSAQPGVTAALDVSRDDAGARSRVDGFITAYNALATQVKALGAYDAATKTAGPMLGDSLLRGIETQMRRLVGDPVSGLQGAYQSLSSIGVSMTLSGTLELDATRFNAAVAADPGAPGRVFASESGVAVRLGQFVSAKLSAGGELAARNDSISAQLRDLGRQRDALDARMQVVQARYQRQFNAMDTLLGQLQSTSGYLAQQLQGLADLASGGNRR